MILVTIEERHLQYLYLLAQNTAGEFPATAAELCGSQAYLDEVLAAAREALDDVQEERDETT